MNIVKEMDYCYLSKMKSSIPKVKIRSSQAAYHCIRQFYHDDIDIYESFFILLLNVAGDTIGYAKISQGTTIGTLVDVKIICKIAIDALAESVILAHNHPSGSLHPSEADKKITEKLIIALNQMDIQVKDHLIVTSNGFYSFRDDGLIQ